MSPPRPEEILLPYDWRFGPNLRVCMLWCGHRCEVPAMSVPKNCTTNFGGPGAMPGLAEPDREAERSIVVCRGLFTRSFALGLRATVVCSRNGCTPLRRLLSSTFASPRHHNRRARTLSNNPDLPELRDTPPSCIPHQLPLAAHKKISQHIPLRMTFVDFSTDHLPSLGCHFAVDRGYTKERPARQKRYRGRKTGWLPSIQSWRIGQVGNR